MQKPILVAGLLLAAFSAPVLAESHDAKSLVLEGDCLAVIEQIDLILETGVTLDNVPVEMDEVTRANIVDLRGQGATEQAAGDESACAATLTLAIQLLNPEG
ncbi:MAG: hypothetical protein L3J13_06450 [Devosiaceae bacterium]|nr:hypothetical protein [Devosiaceae bacterium]